MEDCQIIFSNFLSKERIAEIKKQFSCALQDRVIAAYVFGSFARNEAKEHSDIDLLLVKNTLLPFTARPQEFLDLFDIWTPLDIIVYTKEEFDKLISQPSPGFWTSLKLDLEMILPCEKLQ